MEFEQAKTFLASNHRAVVNTINPNGYVQSSIVVAGAYNDYLALVSIRGSSSKITNLKKNPKCTVNVTSYDWRNYVVVEGDATLIDSTNTAEEPLRLQLREIFQVCGDGTHSDWDEYDRVMKQQDAVIVLINPLKVYGLLR